jgi:hypothetical protein
MTKEMKDGPRYKHVRVSPSQPELETHTDTVAIRNTY